MIPDYYYRKRGHIMGFTKKTWKNRIAEYINRRLITMEDGSTSLVTVARDEGTISQEGDAFNAANMNDLEDRIESEFNEINQSLTQLKNPAKGTKGILVNDGAPLTKDYLLVYTLKTTNVALSGASFSINGIKVGDLVTRTPNSVIEISGCVRAFAGDVITTHVASAGGYADVYAYSPNTI
nr:MAG: hypothetical protein [Bacteriophage sp.]